METSIREQVLKACNMTEEQLVDLQLDTAQKYLDCMAHHNGLQENEIKSSPLFWKWWMQQWQQRDVEFMGCLVHKCHWDQASDYMRAKLQPEALMMYKLDHCVEFLMEKGVGPHKILMKQILIEARKGVCNG